MNLRNAIRSIVPILLLILSAGCSDPTAPLVLKGSRVVIDNQLLSPVSIKVNGIDMGSIDPSSSRTIQRGNLPFVVVEWKLIRPEESGRTLGDTMGGVFTRQLPGDDDLVSFRIDNVIGTGNDARTFFAPLITNGTSAPMEIGVNMDLIDAEQRTGVVVPGGTQRRYIGYYRLGTNSNIRVYSPQVAYSPFLFIEKRYGDDFDVTELDASGSLPLLFDHEPPRTRRRDEDPPERALSLLREDHRGPDRSSTATADR
jgi:hypothetical protein